jgi:hypothetical protein
VALTVLRSYGQTTYRSEMKENRVRLPVPNPLLADCDFGMDEVMRLDGIPDPS